MPDATTSFQRNIAGKNDQIYDYLPAVASVGDFQRIQGVDVLISSIRTLLLTPLGFYPFDPNFGSLLYKKVFDPHDDISKQDIEFEVRQRVQMFDSRIDIEKVEIFSLEPSGKGYAVNVYIKRGKITGKVSVFLPGPNFQFGLEDVT